MSTPQRALLLGSSIRVIVTIARCLSKHGIKVHVASLLPDEPSIKSRAISSFQFLPTEPEAFSHALLDLAATLQIGLIYPCGDEVLDLLGRCESALVGRLRIACPPARVFQQVLDKSITLSLAEIIGIPIPKEYRIPDLTALTASGGDIQFPVIAKARRKDENIAARIQHFESLSELIDEFTRNPTFGENVIIQEFIPGSGVGIEVLIKERKPIALFQHRRLTELPISGGVSVRARSEDVDDQLREHALKLLQALEWEGVAMVEFRQDPESGRLALMEVNGRYWGSLPLSYLAGLEFPWYEWQMSHGVNPTPPKNYHRVTMRWTAGEIDRTIQVFGEVLRGRIPFSAGLREAFSFTMGFFFSVKDAVWRWDDAQPAWIELRKVWRKAFRPQLRKALDKLFPVFWQRKADHKEFGGARAGKLYRQLARGELLINDGRPTVSGKSILVLCHGNIIRSPFVAQRLRTALPAAKIVSAGLACIPGRPADARAITMARKYNVNLEEHRAQPISKTLVNEADVILVMDRRNLAMLLATWPHAASKVYCITNWSEGMTEISDPYNGNMESVGRCYELLNGVCENIAIEE